MNDISANFTQSRFPSECLNPLMTSQHSLKVAGLKELVWSDCFRVLKYLNIVNEGTLIQAPELSAAAILKGDL